MKPSNSPTAMSTSKKGIMTYEEIVEALNVKVLPVEENDNYLDNIIGLVEPKKYLKQTLEFFKKPEIYKNKKVTIYRKFIFIGRSGVGKVMTAYAFAKEANLPIIVVDMEKFVVHTPLVLMKNFKQVLDAHKPAVVLLKNIEYVAMLEMEKQVPVFSTLCNYLNTYTDCFFFATMASTCAFPEFAISENGFNTVLTFEDPDLKQREELLKRFISRFPHAESFDSDEENNDLKKVAKNTLGMTAGDLIHLLENSLIQAYMDGHTELTYDSIDTALSSKMYGHKKKPMTEEARRFTAYHEAGHVVAGYFANPKKYKLSKVEIVHRTESLGLTIDEIDEEKLNSVKEDFENDIISCYGGMAAEEIIFQTSSSGVSADLGMATMYGSYMIKSFGMHKEFGPISLDDEYFVSDALNETADIYLQDMLKDLYKRTREIMIEHKPELIALAEALIEKETIYGEEILEIFKKAREK